MRRNHSIRINFADSEWEALHELLPIFKVDTAQDLLRLLILSTRKSEADAILRYSKASGHTPSTMRVSKEERDTQSIATLRAMDENELSAHLLTIGYFPPDGPLPDNHTTIVKHRYRDGMYRQLYFNASNNTPAGKRDVFTFEELIRDLKKNKLI